MVRVVDDTGDPVEDATVVVRRYRVGPPPHIETHRFEARTDTDGEATFEIDVGKESVMPLMMHGVPQWGFEVCATAPGYSSAHSSWLVVAPQDDRHTVGQIREPLVLVLSPGVDEECTWEQLDSP